ncbi:hypothetical protein GCM10028820_25270 [Tessaracoccus terricola]
MPPANWPRQWLPPGWEPGKPKPRLTAEQREARGQTLLYSLGASVTLAGLVLLIGMAFELSAAVLTYAFALGLGVVTTVLLWRTRSTQIGTPLIVVSAGLATWAAMGAEREVTIPGWLAIVLVSVALALAAYVAWRWRMPIALVWMAWLVFVGQAVFLGSPAALIAPALLLAATIARPWGAHQIVMAVALMMEMVLGAVTFPSGIHTYLILGTTLALGIYLVGFRLAIPVPDLKKAGSQALESSLTGVRVGAQPWPVLILLFVGAWAGSLVARGVPVWFSLVVAGAGCLLAVALPEPQGARPDPHGSQDVFLGVSVSALALSLVVGRVDAPVEQLVLVVLAIVVQIRPLARRRLYSGIIRGIPTLLAFVATIKTSTGVWEAPETVLAEPVLLLQAALLSVLGVAIMVFRHGPPTPVVDAIRLLVGLYFAGYALVIGGAWIGQLLGNMDGGFLTGHAVASICWMLAAVWVALRRRTANAAADLTVALIIAVAAAAKLIAFDMQLLGGIPRVAAFLGCGVLMMAIAFLRQRRRSEQAPPPPGFPPPSAQPPQPQFQPGQRPGPPPQHQQPGPPPAQRWYGPEGGPDAQH